MSTDRPESIFRMSVEGGSVRFFRHRFNGMDYNYSYVVASLRTSALERTRREGETDRATYAPERFSTLEETIQHFDPTGNWVFFTPGYIHPLYREFIWELREQMVAAMPSETAKLQAEERSPQWRHACRRIEIPSARSDAGGVFGSSEAKILGAAIAVVEFLNKESMSTDEIEAFKTSVMTSIDNQLRLYRERSRPVRNRPRSEEPGANNAQSTEEG